MSKRKAVSFKTDDDDGALERALGLEAGDATAAGRGVVGSRFKEKHSLDSDEEDKAEEIGVLDCDEIDGQEETNADTEDGMRFTPFNMRDEMEEGHFDSEGTYIFKKEKEIQDSWIDNIDWAAIKKKDSKETAEESSDSEDEAPIDTISYYRKMMDLMKPGETILKALKRLGGGKAVSASARWKAKKAKVTEETAEEAEQVKKNKEGLLALTELADKLLSQGDMEVYQNTYEKLGFQVKQADEKAQASRTDVPEGMEDDDALDMFADNIDQKKDDDTSKLPVAASKDTSTSAGGVEVDAGVMWQYKWADKEDEEVHGPFTSQQMADWQEDDFFKTGVFVRKMTECASGGLFYSSRRIDFDLYT